MTDHAHIPQDVLNIAPDDIILFIKVDRTNAGFHFVTQHLNDSQAISLMCEAIEHLDPQLAAMAKALSTDEAGREIIDRIEEKVVTEDLERTLDSE